jgi:complement component 1 Q subcomponent-binding protein, mitochondrial
MISKNFNLLLGERELVEFLAEEIVAERKASKGKVPAELDGFKVQPNGADVELVKKSGSET